MRAASGTQRPLHLTGGAPSTRPPLRRLFWTLGRLRSGRILKATDIAREFEVGVRTAYRDLDFLRDEWRAPVEFDRRRGTYALTGPTFSLPHVTLTEGELLGLFFAERVAQQYRGTPYEADLVRALHKIQQFLPDEVRLAPSALEETLSLDLGPVPVPEAETFRHVVHALTARRRIRIRYSSASSGRITDRTVEPYRVYNLRGTWYVAAHDDKHNTVRDFALHRIRRAEVLAQGYAIDPGFDFRAYVGQAFGMEKSERLVSVAIRFGARQARWIRERAWHGSARIQERLDGGCVLRMRVSGLGEIRRWVLQFGDQAEVLAPASLRRAVAQDLAAALRPYGRRRGRVEFRSRP